MRRANLGKIGICVCCFLLFSATWSLGQENAPAPSDETANKKPAAAAPPAEGGGEALRKAAQNPIASPAERGPYAHRPWDLRGRHRFDYLTNLRTGQPYEPWNLSFILAVVLETTYQRRVLQGGIVAKKSNLIVSRDAVFDLKGNKL
jgi:hypothetical protein